MSAHHLPALLEALTTRVLLLQIAVSSTAGSATLVPALRCCW